MKKKDVTERINSYEDAAKELDMVTIKVTVPKEDVEAIQALSEIVTVIRAMKEGKEFDWNDSSQGKYFPWWDTEQYDEPGSSGFQLFYVDCTATRTSVGARLSLTNRDHILHVAKIMHEQYKKWIK